ncbi:MAG: phenylalanine--tRNA ligase subunit beta, partial [Candidatus Sumerlaeota bacterium]|nr:phenylalanine--tRNA ligase subunit beta [Candidatus Sumerlaeota bacterium]
ARDGEQVETLDGQSCVLTTDDLLIADPEKPIALAGIMGCGNTEITENTRNVFLECAYFTPATIRRTSKRLGKSTDSSYRFERGTDWMALPMIIDRAARLIAETAGGEICAGAFDEGTQMSLPEPILLETARVNMLIGCELNDAQIAEPLRALGFEVMPAGAGATNVRAPSFRADVQCDADLVEEIARIRGYNLIPCELPRIQTRANYPDDDNVLTRKLRERLVSEGFTEVSNYSFTSQDSLARCGFDAATAPRLNNPLSAEYAVMRTHLLPGLLESVLYNQNRGTPDVKLFEIGKVYALAAGKDAPDGDSPVSEQWQFAAVISGPCVESTWRIPAQMGDFHAGKAVAESIVRALGASGAESVRPADAQKDMDENWLGALHPGKSAALVMDGRVLLITGELHPRVRARLELKRNVTALFANFAALAPLLARKPKFGDIPLFPVVSRDLAFVAELDTPAAEIENVITKRTKSLLWDIKLFDVYEGEKIPAGKKSLAYSLQFNARDRTLTDDEVNQLQDKILADLKTKLGVELRQ